ncbi:alanine/glycine:cation symporter family protein [Paenibacillus dendritiformis]|uniref:alanine/glycine:cation symporter family protein n=1 Tax=Paenibacillus TaxID=44249 RepID=UPI0010598B0C|nr:alanine/glycine:cation symporter family protein [Paenibacillus dendritiformis]TDL48528.1 alanine:cation symporter family protein [Paenibacillus dendritiformis]WGU93408.1 alanine/glycine:cation symporter family protein [Paenibacillus dendritiformis]
MEFIYDIISFNNTFWSYVLIVILVAAGLYFTFRTKFVQFRMAGEMVRLLGEGASSSKSGQGGVSSFGAFCISTASRVGTGNLAGVALAIATGGPGAVFWMWLIALIGSATAFIESTLAQIYKVKDKGGFRGGPAYYMEKGLNKRWMGVLFAVLITVCYGLVFNSVQANTLSLALESAYGMDRFWVGVVVAALTAFVIFGGVQRIVKASEYLVPVMAGGYVLLALYIVITNLSELPAVIGLIVRSAFGFEQVAGGGLGAAIMLGIKRGLFSNEAGMGSAPNAAAAADVTHPAKQGLVQALGVFVDTLLVCSATAFIVLFSSAYGTEGLTGIELVQAALSAHIGSWAVSFIAIAVFLLAFSSVVGNYYYGETNIEFIKSSKTWLFLYRLAVVGMVLFGSVAKVAIVWDLADLFMAFMAITNLIAIVMLGRIAFDALKDYQEQKRQGRNPVFHLSHFQSLRNVECWGEPTEPDLK